jgi:anti-anti-sigma factor
VDVVVTQEQARVPVTVFHVSGDLNISTYEDFQQRVQEAYEAGTRDIVIDLSKVSYISSAGIRSISAIFRMLRGTEAGESAAAMAKGLKDGTFKSPHLKLCGATGNVAEVLKLAGVDMFLEIHKTLQQALASF